MEVWARESWVGEDEDCMMKVLEYERGGERNSIEVFGLTKSGKTTLLEEFRRKGKKVLEWEGVSAIRKVFLFLEYLMRHPFRTNYLFYKMNRNWVVLEDLGMKDYFDIFRMRNSYLASVLGKYSLLRKLREERYVDEFLLQSLFMIFQTRVSEEELRAVLESLPLSKRVIVVEEQNEVREKRIWNLTMRLLKRF
jgi:hypothetical protein